MDKELFGNPIYMYFVVLAVILAAVLGLFVFKRYIIGILQRMARSTRTSFDDFIVGLVSRLVVPVGGAVIVLLSFKMLRLSPILLKLIDAILVGLGVFFVAKTSHLLVAYAFRKYWEKQGKGEALERSLNGILRVVGFLIWALAVIFYLDNIGFKVSSVIAGLGIGGVAVALAAQAILQDLFSYFSIIFDRPFDVGDFIIVDSFMGTVEYVGIKTTRIRSLSGEQVVFSNTDLTNSRVRNYKRMELRRVVFGFGVVYETPLDKLKKIPQIVENVIKSIDQTRFDRAHFFKYGDFSLDFEVVYYVLNSDYNKYMDIQQEINLKIKEEFEREGIEFAYPTQLLYLAKIDGVN